MVFFLQVGGIPAFFVENFMKDAKSKIKSLFDAIIDQDEFLLVDIEAKPYRDRLELKVFVDKRVGRITLDECARINKALVERLDNDSILDKNYAIEVSSPGLDRPLKNKTDFVWAQGENVEVWLNEQIIDDLKNFNAKIDDVQENEVVFLLKDNRKINVSIENIVKAKIKA